MSGQFHAPASLPPVERTRVSLWIGRCMVAGARLDDIYTRTKNS
jgi:hypothetical protein